MVRSDQQAGMFFKTENAEDVFGTIDPVKGAASMDGTGMCSLQYSWRMDTGHKSVTLQGSVWVISGSTLTAPWIG